MLSVGNVVEVWVPDDECEAARDLTRALEDARDDLSRSKQRLSKFLLRHGLVFDERTPTGAVDWQHLFGRFREGQPRFPELDRRHVAQRRVDPEVVVPVHVVRELGP